MGNDIIYSKSLMYTKKIMKKKMGRKAFIGSELIFSDTVHQFLQVLTLSLMSLDIVQLLYSDKDSEKLRGILNLTKL